jgi:hypothetical protein
MPLPFTAIKKKESADLTQTIRSRGYQGKVFVVESSNSGTRDFKTRHNVFDGTEKIYEWLKKNGPKHGFVRVYGQLAPRMPAPTRSLRIDEAKPPLPL